MPQKTGHLFFYGVVPHYLGHCFINLPARTLICIYFLCVSCQNLYRLFTLEIQIVFNTFMFHLTKLYIYEKSFTTNAFICIDV